MGFARRLVWWAVVSILMVGCGSGEDPGRGAEQASHAARALTATPAPLLVRDVWPGDLASDPVMLANINGTLYFSANDGLVGRELWKSNGTAAGTVLVKDIQVGTQGSTPEGFTFFKGAVYFAADSGYGAQLWKTDGTAAGTVLVKDVYYPRNLTVVGNTLFFSGYDSTRGTELWKTDGTTAGTVLVKDIRSGSSSSNPRSFTIYDGWLYFVANDGSGEELWMSSGSSSGTYMIRGIESDAFAIGPTHLTAYNGWLYFRARGSDSPPLGYELWRSDGSYGNTALFKDLLPGNLSGDPTSLTVFKGGLYFFAANSSGAFALWRSDGTPAGTVPFLDLPIASGFSTSGLFVVQDSLYFVVKEGTRNALWRTDGTVAGTVHVKTFDASAVSMGNLTASGGRLFFYLKGPGDPEPALWVSDGTEAGTRPLGNLSVYFSQGTLADVGGTLFVSAQGVQPQGNELWKSDGTDVGTVQVKNIRTVPGSAEPQSVTAVGDRVYFSANDGVSGQEPWTSDGTEAGTLFLKDIHTRAPSLSNGSLPRGFTAMAGKIFFSADSAEYGRELWTTDGTPAGTTLVRDIAPDISHSNPQQLTLVNGTLFFRATNGSTGNELWKSDGTSAGTVLVKDIRVGFTGSEPDNLTPWSGALLFSANDGSYNGLWKSNGTSAGTVLVRGFSTSSTLSGFTPVGSTLFFSGGESYDTELWKSDGTSAGTVLVKDIRSGFNGSIPGGLVNVNGTLFFAADNGTQGRELWKSDGTNAGTVLVKDIATGSPGSSPTSLVNFGGTLYFAANDGVSGVELWRSDGTEAGTVRVRDIRPGATGSAVTGLVVVEGMLYFVADDGTTGAELWRSDGTEAGTRLVADLAPGAIASAPAQLLRVGTTLFFVADDGQSGRELWRLGVVQDEVPPVVTCPAALSAEATNASGALVAYPPATATDDHTATPVLSYSHASGAVFPLGATLVTVTATDEAGNSATCTFTITVRDTTAPALTCPAAVTVDAQDTEGATVTYPPASASDAVSSPLVTYSQNSGTRFPVGTTAVTVTAKDGADNTSTCAFNVTVRLPPGPAITCPAGSVVEATSSSGATVSYPPATASGSAPLMLSYSHASGAVFPRGTTSVMATATDGFGRSASCTFSILVRDTTSPTVSCPANLTQEATHALGASVTYPAATATDAVTASPSLTYSHASGAVFALGTTNVVATATDEAGNSSTCSFSILVRDTIAPALTCPAAVTVDAQDTEGATVTYPPASASDAVSSPLITYSQNSGTRFPVGTTAVTVTAKDGADNTSTCAFNVTVRLPPGPAITCPAGSVAEATSSSGATVSYPPATASGSAPLTLSYSHASGAMFPFGTTSVVATATDGFGRSASCTFSILVRDTTSPALSCPANLTQEATDALGASVTLPAATATDAVTASPSLGYSHASGAVFPLGATLVTVTAMDEAGNSATCTFTVIVRDTTAPALTCPAAITVDAQDTEGATVTYPPASASDAVSSPLVTYSQNSGTRFPVGTTAVTATAADEVGNTSTCAFNVTVRLPSGPTITCPADSVAEATSGSGATVSYSPATASGSAPLTLSYSHASGAVFPLGTTSVMATATDGFGRSASCSFSILVRDTTAPALTCPADVNVDSQDTEGATVTYPPASASDAVSSSLVTYSQNSGTRFPVGTTAVSVTAKDGAGNTSTCAFNVTVRLPSGPAVTCPADSMAEATGSAGASVSYSPATASGSAPTTLSYSHASGSLFPLGTTSVVATVTDGFGRSASCSFSILVRDTTPPDVTCPGPVLAEAQSATGADVVFSLATAPRDAVTSGPTASFSHASGSRFPLGTTEVQVSATDEAGNSRTCAFTLTVRDTTPPALTCPANVAATASSEQGTTVSYPPASASDAVSSVTLASSHASGALFAPGATSVTLTATDAAGNASSCSFRVDVTVRPPEVEPPPAPPEPVGCSCDVGADTPPGLYWGALLLLAGASIRRRFGRPG